MYTRLPIQTTSHHNKLLALEEELLVEETRGEAHGGELSVGEKTFQWKRQLVLVLFLKWVPTGTEQANIFELQLVKKFKFGKADSLQYLGLWQMLWNENKSEQFISG